MFEQENYHPTNKIINGDPFPNSITSGINPCFLAVNENEPA